MVSRRTLLCSLSLLFLVGFYGCSSDKVIRREAFESPFLDNALSSQDDQVKRRATEAHFDGERLFVKYIFKDTVYYAVGKWKVPDGPAGLSELKTGTLVGGLALPLEQHYSKPWKNLAGDAHSALVLGPEAWDVLMAQVFDTILPEEPLTGVIVDTFTREYFLYSDENRRSRITYLAAKPSRIGINRVWTFSQLLDLTVPYLENYLAKNGIEDRQVLINTSDSGLYAYPFIYADLDKKIVLFAEVSPTTTIEQRLATESDIQLLGHLIGSHVAIIVRPITSIASLIYILGDLAFDLLESGGDLVETAVEKIFLSGVDRSPPPLTQGPGMDLTAFEQRLDEITNSWTSWGTMTYLVDGVEFFPRLIDTMSLAEKTIHFRTYIFDNDDYAITIADILREHSKNVEVKVLMDGAGTIMATRVHAQTMPLAHSPPGSIKSYLEKFSDVRVRTQTNPWFTADHAKLIVIDTQTAFLGGMNIGREYRYERHDIMVELNGPVVNVLQQQFDRAWSHAGVMGDIALIAKAMDTRRSDGPDDKGYPIRVLVSKTGESEIYRTQLEAIRQAKSYIYLENMYYMQDKILEELVKARLRGVDVRVVISLDEFAWPVNRAHTVAANMLIENGVRVFVYPGMLHAKAAIYDGWACLGSANFDKASFKRNRELNVATSHTDSVNELLERVFEPDFRVSYELTEPIQGSWTDGIAEFLTDQL
jgi:cardiolipin synthase